MNINLEYYYGTWFEIYSNILVKNTFESFSKCIKAIYTSLENDNIQVYNQQFNYNNNKIQYICGKASIPNKNENNHLEVTFPYYGSSPYWIYDVGPIINNQYQYAIVSNPSQTNLFVLARNINEFMEKYNDQVKIKLKELGFTKYYNKPILTDQTNCVKYNDIDYRDKCN